MVKLFIFFFSLSTTCYVMSMHNAQYPPSSYQTSNDLKKSQENNIQKVENKLAHLQLKNQQPDTKEKTQTNPLADKLVHEGIYCQGL